MATSRLSPRACLVLGTAFSAMLLSACGNGTAPAPTVTVTRTQGTQASTSAGASPAAAVPPALVAVTTAGALVTLNPATGAVARTLVPGKVQGDEVSVSATGMVYFAVLQGCSSEIEAIPETGGAVAQIAPGSLPAVSPDGTRLAYASEPDLTMPGCVPSTADLVPLYHLTIRTLSSGTSVSYPMEPTSQAGGLPAPISHLSWSADNDHLVVSVSAVQDNEGWNTVILDTAQARYYLTGAGTSYVPATGAPTPRRSYLREAVYLPNGDLFVSRACCSGFPPRNTSRLMWEVDTTGTLVHSVAIGYPSLEHTSLDASTDGQWLLYLAGHDLYVSDGGATPSKLTSGLIAAAWG